MEEDVVSWADFLSIATQMIIEVALVSILSLF